MEHVTTVLRVNDGSAVAGKAPNISATLTDRILYPFWLMSLFLREFLVLSENGKFAEKA